MTLWGRRFCRDRWATRPQPSARKCASRGAVFTQAALAFSVADYKFPIPKASAVCGRRAARRYVLPISARRGEQDPRDDSERLLARANEARRAHEDEQLREEVMQLSRGMNDGEALTWDWFCWCKNPHVWKRNWRRNGFRDGREGSDDCGSAETSLTKCVSRNRCA